MARKRIVPPAVSPAPFTDADLLALLAEAIGPEVPPPAPGEFTAQMAARVLGINVEAARTRLRRAEQAGALVSVGKRREPGARLPAPQNRSSNTGRVTRSPRPCAPSSRRAPNRRR